MSPWGGSSHPNPVGFPQKSIKIYYSLVEATDRTTENNGRMTFQTVKRFVEAQNQNNPEKCINNYY